MKEINESREIIKEIIKNIEEAKQLLKKINS